MAFRLFYYTLYVFLCLISISLWLHARPILADQHQRKVSISSFSPEHKCTCLLHFKGLLLVGIVFKVVKFMQTYIIYMGDRVNPDVSAKDLYIDMLSDVLER